jgi:ubiquinone/menaquinone biosynthesis C-methylase UbiE
MTDSSSGSGLRAHEINRRTFDDFWAGSSVKARLQYSLEGARKDFIAIARMAGIRWNDQHVLDVGFGNGMLMFLFDPSCRLAGTEFSSTALDAVSRKAAARGYRSFAFTNPPDPERLPYADGTFDVVIASHVVEHVESDIDFMRELLRVVKPTGWVFIIGPLDNLSDGMLDETELINPTFASGHYHVRNYNAPSFIARIARAGGIVRQQIQSMHTWDWKVRQDEWRSRLGRSRVGSLIDRGVAVAINVPLSLMPLALLRRVDRWFSRRGFKPRQIAVAVQRAQPDIKS